MTRQITVQVPISGVCSCGYAVSGTIPGVVRDVSGSTAVGQADATCPQCGANIPCSGVLEL